MRIIWDDPLNRRYSSGISQGVLYPENSPGVPWNGLISVTETGDQSQTPRYFDGRKYSNRTVISPFEGTISAYTYPDEFEPYAGISAFFTEQARLPFGFSYRTNDEIHIVYNALTAPSKNVYSTSGAAIDPVAFEWSFTTLPVKIPGGKPSSHLVIMVDESQPDVLADIEALLYGDDENDPSLPTPDDILGLFESSATLQIIDNGDGTWTAIGPDTVITMLDSTTFQIDWPSAIFIDSTTYWISSL